MRIAKTLVTLSVFFLAAAGPSPAQSAVAVPRLIRLTNTFHPANGLSVSPVESVTLSLYRDQTGGAPLWTETQNVAMDADGHYTVLMGSTLPDGVPADLFNTTEPRWLGVQFNRLGEVEQARVLLASVPYAFKAADADTLGGKPPSAYLLAPSSTAAETSSSASAAAANGATPGSVLKPRITSGMTGCLGVFTNSTDLGCSVMWEAGSDIGVGTTTPAYTLDVNGNIHTPGTLFVNDNAYSIRSTAGAFVLATCCNGITAFYSGQTSWGLRNSTDSTWLMYIQNTGNVGIGTASPSYRLDVSGDMNFNGALRYAGTTVLHFPGGALTNFAFGASALQNNVTGAHNTATGTLTLFSNNSGSYNTAVGEAALDTNSSGSSNTAIGFDTLLANSSGSNNIALGYQAGYSVTGSNNIEIGNQGSSGDSGVIRIGSNQTAFYAAGIYGANSNGIPVYISSNGQLGTVSSSRRYKEDIHDMGDASRGLMRLRPVTFRYKKPFDDGSKPMQYGLIAEEVENVYPDLVAHSADGRIETVKYQMLAPMLLNEAQRQNKEIKAQQDQVRSLHEQLEAQQRLILQLQERLVTLETEVAGRDR